MPVKVVIKGQKKEDPPGTIPVITPPQLKKRQDNIILRTVKVMLMDIRMRLNPELKAEYQDYARFAELARGKK